MAKRIALGVVLVAGLAGKTGLVFDAGSGSVRKLGAMGYPMPRMQAAFITHIHSDHIDGMGELLLQAWMAGGRASPLPVYGPPGTAAVVEGFDAAYTPDKALRDRPPRPCRRAPHRLWR